jgi:hypothetical protein
MFGLNLSQLFFINFSLEPEKKTQLKKKSLQNKLNVIYSMLIGLLQITNWTAVMNGNLRLGEPMSSTYFIF